MQDRIPLAKRLHLEYLEPNRREPQQSKLDRLAMRRLWGNAKLAPGRGLDAQMLTDIERERIRLEERYRAEIRRSTQETHSGRLQAWLNSSFGLWLLSAIFVSGAGTLYTRYQARIDAEKVRFVAVERLDLEIAYRFSQGLVRLEAVKARYQNAPGLLRAQMVRDVQQALRSWKAVPTDQASALYPEHGELSLAALLADLRRQLSPGKERDDVDRILAEIVGGGKAHHEFNGLRDADGAGRVLIELLLPRWRGNWFFYTDCSPDVPFC